VRCYRKKCVPHPPLYVLGCVSGVVAGGDMGELAAHDPCWHSNRRALGLCGRTLLLRVVMNI
jgi:hypothetical protein